MFNHESIESNFQVLVHNIVKKFDIDFAGDYLSAGVVLLGETKPDLFENEFSFFAAFHGSECFDLKVIYLTP